jgi:hypothetical protein
LEPTLSDFAELRKIAKQLQQQPQSWADALPPNTFRQRKDSGTQSRSKVAYFLVDALCHEMAKEFFSDLQKASPKVSSVTPPKARSAELPSLTPKKTTEVPARTSNWPLFPAEKDFQRLKKDLYSKRSRKQSLRAERSSDDVSSIRPSEGQGTDSASGHRVEFLKLKEVCEQTIDRLEQSCLEADLIVVDGKEIGIKERELNQSQEIRDAGEKKVSLVAFGHWIEEVQMAWDRLRNLGVQEFVFITGNAGQTVVSTEVSAVQEPSNLQESSAFKVKYHLEAEAKPEMLGYSRLQIRVKAIAESPGGPTNSGPKLIHLALRVPDRPDILVTLKDAPGAVMNNLNKHQLAIILNQDWIEVLFDLTGPQDEQVQVEVYEPEAEEEIVPASLEASFRVVGTLPDEIPDEADALPASTRSPIPTNHSSAWQDSFEDENIRAVFIHLQRHGSVTENELTQFLGGARKARSFSLAFEEYLKKVPFSVRIETTASGKRYVKET